MTPRVLRLLFWTATLFTLVMALLPHPPEVPGEPSDKVQHILAFTVLAALVSLAYPRHALRAAIGLIAFGAAIEVLQMIPALHRDAQLSDWIADTIAACLVLLAFRLFRRPARA